MAGWDLWDAHKEAAKGHATVAWLYRGSAVLGLALTLGFWFSWNPLLLVILVAGLTFWSHGCSKSTRKTNFNLGWNSRLREGWALSDCAARTTRIRVGDQVGGRGGLHWNDAGVQDRCSTDEEHELQLKQKVRLDIEPGHDQCVIRTNSTFLESVDRYYAWRRATASLGLLILAMGILFGVDAVYIDVTSNSSATWLVVLDVLFFGSICAVAMWIQKAEVFTYTHFPIRLNRKNRKVYVFRPGRPNKPIPLPIGTNYFLPSGDAIAARRTLSKTGTSAPMCWPMTETPYWTPSRSASIPRIRTNCAVTGNSCAATWRKGRRTPISASRSACR